MTISDEELNNLSNNMNDDVDDDEVESNVPTPAEEVLPENPETQEALSKLRASTAKLGTAIKRASVTVDERIGLSASVSKLNESVKKVDEERGLSQSVKQASSRMGGWFSSLDEQYNISQKTLEIKGALGDKVKPLKDNVGESLKQSKRNLQVFDESHGITRSTASTLASGADLLADSLGGGEEEERNETEVVPESLELDKDDSKPV